MCEWRVSSKEKSSHLLHDFLSIIITCHNHNRILSYWQFSLFCCCFLAMSRWSRVMYSRLVSHLPATASVSVEVAWSSPADWPAIVAAAATWPPAYAAKLHLSSDFHHQIQAVPQFRYCNILHTELSFFTCCPIPRLLCLQISMKIVPNRIKFPRQSGRLWRPCVSVDTEAASATAAVGGWQLQCMRPSR